MVYYLVAVAMVWAVIAMLGFIVWGICDAAVTLWRRRR